MQPPPSYEAVVGEIPQKGDENKKNTIEQPKPSSGRIQDVHYTAQSNRNNSDGCWDAFTCYLCIDCCSETCAHGGLCCCYACCTDSSGGFDGCSCLNSCDCNCGDCNCDCGDCACGDC